MSEQHQLTEEALKKYAKEVRAAYLRRRYFYYLQVRGSADNYNPHRDLIKKWDGGRDYRGINHTSIWEKIVRFAFQHEVQPADLIEAIFHNRAGRNCPLPTEALSPKVLDRLQEVRQHNLEKLPIAYASFQEEAVQEFTLKKRYRPQAPEKELWREVICCSDYPFTRLFRFCLAAELEIDDVAAYYRKDALMEYLQAPQKYNEILHKFLPRDFREEARRLYYLLSR